MSEWDRRELCPDGTCVGVIGSDGKCKVCGKEGASGGASDFGLRTSAREDGADDVEANADVDADADADAAVENEASDSDSGRSPQSEVRSPAAAGGDDWSQRQLCPDGACVGVIGDEGKCTVCGRTAA